MNIGPVLRLLPILAALVLLAGCAAPQPRQDFSHDGLELVNVRGLDEVWVRPGTDFTQFRTLLIEPVEVAFDPLWDPRRTGSRLSLPESERERIRSDAAELFDRSFQREIDRSSRFNLVESAQADTLVFKPRIVDLFINAPDDRMAPGLTRTFVSEFGRVTLIGELREAESGAIVARITDREIARAVPQLELTDRFTNEREGQRIFSSWARTLVDRLDGLSNR
ncbi:MAG: DUF3313 family protein [Wenzhouxiangella sp.]